MRISRYFTDLMATYVAEIDDLKTDSGGSDVLKERLKDRRSQIADLMPMMESNPEMMAVAFHKSIVVKDVKAILNYLPKEPSGFPSWDLIAPCVQFEPWATATIAMLKKAEGGEQFLLTTVMLEYMFSRYEVSEDHHQAEESDDDENSEDLNEAGGEWLADQGFDSHE
jgi:hypothetical protein